MGNKQQCHISVMRSANSCRGVRAGGLAAVAAWLLAVAVPAAELPELALVGQLRGLAVAAETTPEAWRELNEKVAKAQPAAGFDLAARLSRFAACRQALTGFSPEAEIGKLASELAPGREVLAAELRQVLAWEARFLLRSPQILDLLAAKIEAAPAAPAAEVVAGAWKELLDQRRSGLQAGIAVAESAAATVPAGTTPEASRSLVLAAFGVPAAAEATAGDAAAAVRANQIFWDEYMAKCGGEPAADIVKQRIDAAGRLGKLMAALGKVPAAGQDLPPQDLAGVISQAWNTAAAGGPEAARRALASLRESGVAEFLKSAGAKTADAAPVRSEITELLAARGLAFANQAEFDRFVMLASRLTAPAPLATIRRSEINWGAYLASMVALLEQTAAMPARGAAVLAGIGSLDALLAAGESLKVMTDIPEAGSSPARLSELLVARRKLLAADLEWALAVDRAAGRAAPGTGAVLNALKR